MCENSRKTLSVLLSFIVASVLLSGCSGGDKAAATVNGEKIREADVKARVEVMRSQSSDYKSKEGWEESLKQAQLTPETLRRQIIDGMARSMLIAEAAKKEGIKADQKSINRQIEEIKKNASDKDALSRLYAGYGVSSEDELRGVLANRQLEEKLKEKVTSGVSLSQDEIDDYIKNNASGMQGRNSMEILLTAEDGTVAEQKELAEQIIRELRYGSDFSSLARKYSRDKTSAEQGGIKGWSSLVELPQEYKDALAKLKAGEISDPIPSPLGVHIIKCTKIFAISGAVAIADIPEEIKTRLAEEALAAAKQSAYREYSDGLFRDAKIEVSKMPNGEPYA